MKLSYRNILMSTVLATVVGATAVTAQAADPAEDMKMANQFMETAQAYVQSAVGADGNVLVVVDGEVATLFGFVNNSGTKMKAEAAALKDSRISSVRNRVVASN